jgi:hypothetical protein
MRRIAPILYFKRCRGRGKAVRRKTFAGTAVIRPSHFYWKPAI